MGEDMEEEDPISWRSGSPLSTFWRAGVGEHPYSLQAAKSQAAFFPHILVFLCPEKNFDVAMFPTIVETIAYFSKSKELVYCQAPG